MTSLAIHPTAIIDPTAVLSAGVVVGPYAVIGPETELAEGVSVGAHAILEYATLGKNCRIHPHAFIGTPPQDLKYKGEKTRAILGENTVVRECATINRGTSASGQTVIGSHCLLMAYAHVAHDCVLGDNVIMANVGTLAGHVQLGRGVVVGGLVAVHQFVRVGEGAMLGGGACVAADVAPYCLAQGDRAKLMGLNGVGLRRRGVSAANIQRLKEAYRRIFLSGLVLEEALDSLERESPPQEVHQMVSFLRQPSHGVCRPARATSSSPANE